MKKKIRTLEKEFYIAPDIVVVEIVTEHNILASGSSNDLDGFNYDEWF